MAKKDSGAGVPAALRGHPAIIVIYNNLPTIEATTFQCPTDDVAKAALATEIDVAMRERAPAGWKSDTEGPKGIQVLNALFPIMSRDREATKAIFDIIKNQPGYS